MKTDLKVKLFLINPKNFKISELFAVFFGFCKVFFTTLNKQNPFIMGFIDTHCHLYLKEFATDIDEVINRAEARA